MKKLLYLFALGIVISMGTVMTSCSDDDSAGTPQITGVRVCDPLHADSLFEKSAQGQMIAIIGRNLGNAQKVFINDQKVSFSTTMNTDHSIIVTVPSETDGFQLTAFNSELKDEIRVETNGGTATYPFKVLATAPSISRIQCTYPRKTGDVLKVYGSNLISIEDIYFTDLTAAHLDTTSWEEIGGNHVAITDCKTSKMDHYLDSKKGVYITDSQLEVVIPDLPFDEGCLVLECTAGTRYFAFTKTPGKPVIKSVSSDMPVLGETLLLKGNEFVQVDNITMGDVVYSAEEINVSEDECEIEIPITKLPSAGSEPKLTINTPGGTYTVDNFYNYATLLNDFDDMLTAGTVADLGWDPNAEYIENWANGGTGKIAHIESAGGWWDKMVFFRRDWNDNNMVLPSFDVIPADAPADKVYLAFEAYDDNSDWNNDGSGYQGYLRLNIWFGGNFDTGNTADITYDNFAWDNYEEGTFKNPDGPMLMDVDKEAHVGKWYRTVIPMSALTAKDADLNVTATPYKRGTYKDIYNNGISIIRFMALNQGAKPGKMNFYMDNVRIIYVK